ncbi:MAG: hypothetical protein IJ744_11195 [Lachnospiraceae bacterium]|nr:hypothetical protein [Lachnospiraceae bacterium]
MYEDPFSSMGDLFSHGEGSVSKNNNDSETTGPKKDYFSELGDIDFSENLFGNNNVETDDASSRMAVEEDDDTPILQEPQARPHSRAGIYVVCIVAVLAIIFGIALNRHSKTINNSYTENTVVANQGESITNNAPINNNSTIMTNTEEESLSLSCDYILCAGYDSIGNFYELVANQSETAAGFEISIGIIKNNDWLYFPSSSFPFLAEDGLFHVSVSLAGESGTSLKHPGENAVIDNLYYIDSGAFLIDCYKANKKLSIYDHYYIVFSCDTLESTMIDCADTTVFYSYSKPTFASEHVVSYGQMYTDQGELITCTETSGTSSGWLSDQVYQWDIFDTKTLTMTTIASNVRGVRPTGILAEGKFFCTDKCFYNTNGQKVIDLSSYDIDVYEDGDIFFEDGRCTFKVANSLGTKFLITIDATGSVISEIQE